VAAVRQHQHAHPLAKRPQPRYTSSSISSPSYKHQVSSSLSGFLAGHVPWNLSAVTGIGEEQRSPDSRVWRADRTAASACFWSPLAQQQKIFMPAVLAIAADIVGVGLTGVELAAPALVVGRR